MTMVLIITSIFSNLQLITSSLYDSTSLWETLRRSEVSSRLRCMIARLRGKLHVVLRYSHVFAAWLQVFMEKLTSFCGIVTSPLHGCKSSWKKSRRSEVSSRLRCMIARLRGKLHVVLRYNHVFAV